LDRENAVSLRAMAELRMAQGNLSEAANYYRALVRINPSDLDMQQKLAQVVRALEPANDGAGLPVGQEADLRPSPKATQQPEAGPALLGIEAAVEKALEDLRTPEALVPVWHMEDRAPTTPTQNAPAEAARGHSAPAQTRRPGRAPVQFFDYSNRRSDFSMFARWVERERGGARK
jgi:hypothetical protein